MADFYKKLKNNIWITSLTLSLFYFFTYLVLTESLTKSPRHMSFTHQFKKLIKSSRAWKKPKTQIKGSITLPSAEKIQKWFSFHFLLRPYSEFLRFNSIKKKSSGTLSVSIPHLMMWQYHMHISRRLLRIFTSIIQRKKSWQLLYISCWKIICLHISSQRWTGNIPHKCTPCIISLLYTQERIIQLLSSVTIGQWSQAHPSAHIWGVVGILSMNKWGQDHTSKNTRITYSLVRHYVFKKDKYFIL